MPQTETQPTKRMTRVKTRSVQLRELHQEARAKGFVTAPGKAGREKYEAELEKAIGKRSALRASRTERVATIAHFKALKPLEVAPYSADDFSDESALAVLGW